jgi:hypothetical protein
MASALPPVLAVQLIPFPQHFIYSELRQQGGGFLELGVATAMFLQEAWAVEWVGQRLARRTATASNW